MHKANVNKQSTRGKNKSVENSTGWDSAIQDAKMRIKRMKESIRVFQRMRDAGESWHGAVQGLDRKRQANG
jgi:hypothetical protein